MIDRQHQLLCAALAQARQGFHVFPLRPGGKTPAIRNWQSRATLDRAQIRRWWADNSGKNIGIATGSPSGIMVIDLDAAKTPGQPHGRQSLAALARDRGETIPRRTRTVVTAERRAASLLPLATRGRSAQHGWTSRPACRHPRHRGLCRRARLGHQRPPLPTDRRRAAAPDTRLAPAGTPTETTSSNAAGGSTILGLRRCRAAGRGRTSRAGGRRYPQPHPVPRRRPTGQLRRTGTRRRGHRHRCPGARLPSPHEFRSPRDRAHDRIRSAPRRATYPPLPHHGGQALPHTRASDGCGIHMRIELSTDRTLQTHEGETVVIVTG